ncbi:helix-turn-helix transcriptional regulator [Phenylobacterium sp.]|uniref:helix-turn-helix domain-containing protein n=1 Tax=Phenylobacterium sp. TaxID=1871053 RepID=UPI0025D04B7C|nr:helix-turn-helix transcriptional regulator [Phenylobacterium sp.]MBX3482510.1 helix-turn-helix domain-containing protein [Phenylobacterium sp.]
MPLTHAPKKAEQQLNGQALYNLRNRADVTLATVGRALGMTGAGWHNYEKGDRKFSADKIEKALSAIGATEHDFEAERARILQTPSGQTLGFAEAATPFIFNLHGRPDAQDSRPTRRLDLRQVLGRTIDALEVASDRVSPWAESGELVLFDRARSPRRGKGCVIELKSGGFEVLLYEKSDGSRYYVKELYPEERVVTYSVSDVRGVFPVVFRGD